MLRVPDYATTLDTVIIIVDTYIAPESILSSFGTHPKTVFEFVVISRKSNPASILIVPSVQKLRNFRTRRYLR